MAHCRHFFVRSGPWMTVQSSPAKEVDPLRLNAPPPKGGAGRGAFGLFRLAFVLAFALEQWDDFSQKVRLVLTPNELFGRGDVVVASIAIFSAAGHCPPWAGLCRNPSVERRKNRILASAAPAEQGNESPNAETGAGQLFGHVAERRRDSQIDRHVFLLTNPCGFGVSTHPRGSRRCSRR